MNDYNNQPVNDGQDYNSQQAQYGNEYNVPPQPQQYYSNNYPPQPPVEQKASVGFAILPF